MLSRCECTWTSEKPAIRPPCSRCLTHAFCIALLFPFIILGNARASSRHCLDPARPSRLPNCPQASNRNTRFPVEDQGLMTLHFCLLPAGGGVEPATLHFSLLPAGGGVEPDRSGTRPGQSSAPVPAPPQLCVGQNVFPFGASCLQWGHSHTFSPGWAVRMQ